MPKDGSQEAATKEGARARDEDGKSKAESFKVFARLRPAANGQSSSGDIRVVRSHGQQSIIQAKNLEFLLDRVWDTGDTQESVYKECKERVSWVLEGFSSTLLCYGQTGSGKTHTMFGPQGTLDSANFARSDRSTHGIVPRACIQLFDQMAKTQRDVTFVVHVSYVEAYNDHLHDLLAGDEKRHLVLRENPKSGLAIEGLSHTLVSSPSEVMRAVMRGDAQRVVAAMKMNERSSRGHAVITINVREVRGEGSERSGKLTLVDLAGMESSKKSYAVEGASKDRDRVEEMKHINQSLWALGTVIERLSSITSAHSSREKHVPYRDSKLTYLLQDSLGGNSKTLMFVNCGPSQFNCAETLNSLNFASRAKAVALGKATKNREALQKQPAKPKASTTMAAASRLGD